MYKYICAFFIIVTILSSCKSTVVKKEKTPEKAVAVSQQQNQQAQPNNNNQIQQAQQYSNQQSDANDKWQKVFEEYKNNQKVKGEEDEVAAEAHYKLALSYRQAGDLEKAEFEAKEVLRYNPNYEAAKALLSEVMTLEGKEKFSIEAERFKQLIAEENVHLEQRTLELESIYSKGIREFELEKYNDAEREFKTIVEIVKWIPSNVIMDAVRKKAQEMLEKTQEANKNKKLEESKLKQKLIEDEVTRQEYARKLEEKRRIELLFDQARLEFERENYQEAINLAEKLLYINPSLKPAKDIITASHRIIHGKATKENLVEYIEYWKKIFEQINLNSILQTELLKWTDRDTWAKISQRKASVAATEEEKVAPENQEIYDKLKTIKVDIDAPNIPLPNVIDFIRDYTKLNIVFDVKDKDLSQELITIKIKEIPLENALKIILDQKGLGYKVENGVIVITTPEKLKKLVQTEFYDVSDLIFSIVDFPGEDFQIKPGQGAVGAGIIAVAQQGEPRAPFDMDAIQKLIKDTVKGGEKTGDDFWKEDNSITPQGNFLIIKAPKEAHKQVKKLLSDLRAASNVLVNIEARFFLVQESMLRDIGIDYGNISNANGPVPPSLTPILNLNQVQNNQNNTQIFRGAAAGIAGAFDFDPTTQQGQLFGARVENLIINDFLPARFNRNIFNTAGGTSLQYQFSLLNNTALNAILHAVEKSEKSRILNDVKVTLTNTQRGNFIWSNQITYIKDVDVEVAALGGFAKPIVDVLSQGISLDVKPIVSADRRFITLELRPSFAIQKVTPPRQVNLQVPIASIGGIINLQNFSIDAPELEIQRVRTTVVVPDMGTLLVGGMITFLEANAEQKIPFIGDVPILGTLLGSERFNGLQKNQALILVKPTIIIPQEEERKKF